MPLLDVQNCTKQFGGLTAVNGFTLSLEAGELVGLIGPNGAGKTTAFNLLTGVYAPTSGSIEFGGLDWSASSRIRSPPPACPAPSRISACFQL